MAFLQSLSDEEAAALLYDWAFWARPAQLAPPGDWGIWLVQAGRGWGKTRVGAEWVRAQVETGRYRRIALVARTPADARDIMIEGESGLLNVVPPGRAPRWNPSMRRLTWPNGAIATTYSSWEPDMLRGPQHDAAWCDELASWRYPQTTWDNLMFGLRLGAHPRVVITTTPKPVKLLRELKQLATTVVTRGSTYDNAANLAASFMAEVIKRYEGTRLGRQELEAEDLEDNPGALWQRDIIERNRVTSLPELRRIVVGVDPEASSGEDSAETGIVAVGLGVNDHLYVLEDASLRASPHGWASAVVTLYHKLKADRIIGEENQGGEMVESTVRTVDANVSYKRVHASRGKQARAEPVAALYEQGRAHHVGMFAELEDQMCQWVPGEKSPDRIDALVWGATELMGMSPSGGIWV